jgi:hypothetical protein
MSSRESDHSLFGRHPGDAWGLYLDACLVDTEFPFEDGSPLVLPYALRASGVAVTAHGKRSEEHGRMLSYTKLLSIFPCQETRLSRMQFFMPAAPCLLRWFEVVGARGIVEPCTAVQEADVVDSGRSLNQFVPFALYGQDTCRNGGALPSRPLDRHGGIALLVLTSKPLDVSLSPGRKHWNWSQKVGVRIVAQVCS